MSIPKHPTTVCSIAADLYMKWAAVLPQVKGGSLLRPGEVVDGLTLTPQQHEAAQAARAAYETHVKKCKICRGEA
jgi:hypothetical protein